ncbi:hypothetical protein NDU88_004729 [Pleurodeles waltl]|uniref:Uncharacterized protein n=1 Tax=Pleurodeles waltl TaxID=8319 RepID=A0AAV7LKQ3_PLEWA|nr:hypothetical protein NDU88_004729 [Pleurodeles waltl]
MLRGPAGGGGCRRNYGLPWTAATAARKWQLYGERGSLAVRRWREMHFRVRTSDLGVRGPRMGRSEKGPGCRPWMDMWGLGLEGAAPHRSVLEEARAGHRSEALVSPTR